MEIAVLGDPGRDQSLASVKAHLSAVVDSIHETHKRVTVTKNGVPTVPLQPPLEGKWSARRGQYRTIYTIDGAAHVVTVLHISHRRDADR